MGEIYNCHITLKQEDLRTWLLKMKTPAEVERG